MTRRQWTLPLLAAVADPRDLRGVSEYAFQVAVCRYAEDKGFIAWYTRRSGHMGEDGKWRGSGPKGEPDLRLINPFQRRALWVELKSEGGRLTDQQRCALDYLTKAGQEAGWFRPRDAKRLMRVLDGERLGGEG